MYKTWVIKYTFGVSNQTVSNVITVKRELRETRVPLHLLTYTIKWFRMSKSLWLNECVTSIASSVCIPPRTSRIAHIWLLALPLEFPRATKCQTFPREKAKNPYNRFTVEFLTRDLSYLAIELKNVSQTNLKHKVTFGKVDPGNRLFK